MKTLGVIGGIGPESTIEYLDLLRCTENGQAGRD
jgi:aspartate/glutamate racemase